MTRAIPTLKANKGSSDDSLDRSLLGNDESDYITSDSAEIDAKNALTGWKLYNLVLLGGNLLALIILTGLTLGNFARGMPVFITRGNGETENLQFFSGTDRSPELIKFFVQKTLTSIYSWRNVLPEKENFPDPGMMVGDGMTIPTTAFRYSLALEPNFATEFRKELAKLKSIVDDKDRTTQTTLIIRAITEPEKISAGKWKLRVNATQIIYHPNRGISKMLPINVETIVRAVSPPTLSEVERKYQDIGIAKAAQLARSQGLEFESIVNIKG